MEINNKEYILCAAIWLKTKKIFPHQPKNIKNGIVICGHRHHNCISILVESGLTNKVTKENCVQGFLTSDNEFVDREKAYKVAYVAEQINIKTVKKLMSEDLY